MKMSQLNINYCTIDEFNRGIVDVREIKDGKEVTFSYFLCDPTDFQEFLKNIREKRRTFLVLEENGIRTFELLVDEKGNATFRYPEWSTLKELKTTIGEIHHLVQFPIVERDKLKKIVYQYVKNSFEKIDDKDEYPFKFITPSNLSMLSEEYLNDLLNEATKDENGKNYCYIAFYEWLENRFSEQKGSEVPCKS